jgi:hypothetical protein
MPAASKSLADLLWNLRGIFASGASRTVFKYLHLVHLVRPRHSYWKHGLQLRHPIGSARGIGRVNLNGMTGMTEELERRICRVGIEKMPQII